MKFLFIRSLQMYNHASPRAGVMLETGSWPVHSSPLSVLLLKRHVKLNRILLLPLCRNVDYFSRDVFGYRDAAVAAMFDETFLAFFWNKFPIGWKPITALCRADDKRAN
jgi:hypothetical protein